MIITNTNPKFAIFINSKDMLVVDVVYPLIKQGILNNSKMPRLLPIINSLLRDNNPMKQPLSLPVAREFPVLPWLEPLSTEDKSRCARELYSLRNFIDDNRIYSSLATHNCLNFLYGMIDGDFTLLIRQLKKQTHTLKDIFCSKEFVDSLTQAREKMATSTIRSNDFTVVLTIPFPFFNQSVEKKRYLLTCCGLTSRGNFKLLKVMEVGYKDDYAHFKTLFSSLKQQGLEFCPKVAMDFRPHIKLAIENVFPEYAFHGITPENVHKALNKAGTRMRNLLNVPSLPPKTKDDVFAKPSDDPGANLSEL